MSANAERETAADGFASMTLEAGARLGYYRILGLLGRGGMADVYRAEDERLGREVALKLVPPEFARDPDRVERFEREVRAAAKLTHPNIVTVHEFGRDGDQPFYTMALMRGGDLKARVRSHPEGMPPEEARRIAQAVARALAYAHGEGFVHRDVKPENVLFGEEEIPHLTDFGIARAMSSGTRMTATGMNIGSPHYMSPEQARGRAVDGRSDLYSLGVVLYEMLTGRVPFDAADTLAVAYSHVNDPVPVLPGHLAGWQPLLDRLLAKSPEDRYGSARELADVLGSGALPQASETRADAVSEMPSAPPGTRVMPKAGEVGRTAVAKEFVPRAAEAGPLRRVLLAVVAGAVLALAVVGLLYSMSRENYDRLSSGGSGGTSGERMASSSNTSPSAPDSPLESLIQRAEQGHANAQHSLGARYRDGQGVPQDYAEAVRWYRLAAEQGHANAQNSLGYRYQHGQGVPQDYAEAVRWYRLAAEQGHANAQASLGGRYRDGQGVPQDYAEAVRWYRLAAEQGHANAQNSLGYRYQHGQGVDQDYAEAVRWYRLAAEQGHANAQASLGGRYRDGQGVPQDYAEAVRWYRLAAEQGDASAQNSLGRRYEEGQGVARDLLEAIRWYTMAAEQGNEDARKALDRLR